MIMCDNHIVDDYCFFIIVDHYLTQKYFSELLRARKVIPLQLKLDCFAVDVLDGTFTPMAW